MSFAIVSQRLTEAVLQMCRDVRQLPLEAVCSGGLRHAVLQCGCHQQSERHFAPFDSRAPLAIVMHFSFRVFCLQAAEADAGLQPALEAGCGDSRRDCQGVPLAVRCPSESNTVLCTHKFLGVLYSACCRGQITRCSWR